MFVIRRLFPAWFRLGGAGCGRWERPETLSVVLLSYRRPANLSPIVAACLACPFVRRVILSNNDPTVDIGAFVRQRDPRLEVIRQPVRSYPSKRYEIALQTGDEWLLCIDDDTFLTPRQVRALFEALLDDRGVPHGVAGEHFGVDGGVESYAFGRHGRGEAVDCLVWAYAFTRRHVERYFELLRAVGIDNAALHANEDIVLSLSGEGPALVHHVGTLHLCSSRDAQDVATSRQAGFREQRVTLLHATRAAADAGGRGGARDDRSRPPA